ncbi:MAG: hypothetical protein E7071_00255 [Bacteroidales bacterium]|nr:hypothetical protein [Bacteroidales bacterium]
MNRRYYKERIKHAFRFRTKRGYGVHSPFMFNLIMTVLRDKKSNLYTYPNFSARKRADRKLLRLSYRLMLHLKMEKVFILGNRGDMLMQSIPAFEYETSLENIKSCNYVWLDNNNIDERELLQTLQLWARGINEHHSILITNIHKSPQQRTIWQALSREAKVKVEMMWCGILIFDEKLQPGSYHLLP